MWSQLILQVWTSTEDHFCFIGASHGKSTLPSVPHSYRLGFDVLNSWNNSSMSFSHSLREDGLTFRLSSRISPTAGATTPYCPALRPQHSSDSVFLDLHRLIYFLDSGKNIWFLLNCVFLVYTQAFSLYILHRIVLFEKECVGFFCLLFCLFFFLLVAQLAIWTWHQLLPLGNEIFTEKDKWWQ